MAKRFGEEVYLPYELVTESYNPRFYWDESEQTMVYTTAYDIYKFPVDSSTYTLNESEERYDCDVVKKIDGSLYLNLDYVKGYFI